MKFFSINRISLFLKFLFVALVLGFIIRGFLLIPIAVQGNSMENTLHQGDMVIMEKLSSIERFDVVVFQLPDGATYIKRVIGLPGDKISYKNDVLYINGNKVAEPFLENNQRADHAAAPYTTNFDLKELLGVEELPENSYFVMGDNRRLSKDSRSFGAITSDEILGQARIVYYPFHDIRYIH